MPRQVLVLGIDAGGTKTSAWLADARGEDNPVIAKAVAGPGNLQAVGKKQATANTNHVVRDVLATAKCSEADVRAVCLGGAGCDRPNAVAHWTSWGSSHFETESFILVHDAELVLAAGTPEQCGVALIAGTGSLAWGRDPDGSTCRSGGWGYLFSDEGSAFAVGRAALQSMMAASDRRADATRVTQHVCDRLSLGSPADIVATIYAATDPRIAIAQLAPVVFDAAAENDVIAMRILSESAADLASMIASVVRQLRFSPTPPLAFAGGLLTGQPDYCRLILDHLGAAGAQCGIPHLVDEPVAGAVQIAVRELRKQE